jgi:hypothetical protein
VSAIFQISKGPDTEVSAVSQLAAGLTSSPMEMAALVAMIDAANQIAAKRGAYKRKAA